MKKMVKKIADEFIGEGILPEEITVRDNRLVDDELTDDQKLDILKSKCEFFCTHKLMTHISTSRNGYKYFYNGKIEKVSEEYIVFQDRKLGLMMIAYREIYDIQKMLEEIQ